MRRPSRWVLLAAAVLALVAVLALMLLERRSEPAGGGDPPRLAGSAREFTYNESAPPAPGARFFLDDRPVNLTDFAGELVLLNFWATWCGPCVAEMPALDRLAAALENEGLAVLTVSVDRTLAPVRQFFKQHELEHLGLYHDPDGSFSRAFAVRGLPTSVLISAEGRIVGTLEGPAEWDGEPARAFLRHHLPR